MLSERFAPDQLNLVSQAEWKPYPTAAERAAWEQLPAALRHSLIASGEAALVIMHNRAEKDATLDIVDDLRRYFDHSLALAAKDGIPGERIILDPGIGFGKTTKQNIEAVRRLSELRDYGRPFLVGVSRKKFLGRTIGGGAEGELVGTVAAALAAAASGASLFRVHDVAAHVAALKVFDAIRSS